MFSENLTNELKTRGQTIKWLCTQTDRNKKLSKLDVLFKVIRNIDLISGHSVEHEWTRDEPVDEAKCLHSKQANN